MYLKKKRKKKGTLNRKVFLWDFGNFNRILGHFHEYYVKNLDIVWEDILNRWGTLKRVWWINNYSIMRKI